MAFKSATVSVNPAEWDGRPTYCLNVGPAKIEIYRRERQLRVELFGHVVDIPLTGGRSLHHRTSWWELEVTENVSGYTKFTLTWEERADKANMVQWSQPMDPNKWEPEDKEWVLGVKYWPDGLTQQQLNELTSPAAEQQNEVLLLL